MKIRVTLLIILLLSSILWASEPPPSINTEIGKPVDITTPTWTTEPIQKPPSTPFPYSKMMRNKHAAAVIIGTTATIIIGLLVTGNDTGKRAVSLSNK